MENGWVEIKYKDIPVDSQPHLIISSLIWIKAKNSSQKILSATCRPTVGQQSANCWLSVGRLLANCWPTVGRPSIDSRPTDSQQLVDCQPTVGRQTANSQPTVFVMLQTFTINLYYTNTKYYFNFLHINKIYCCISC